MTGAQRDLLLKSARCLQAAELLLGNGFPADAVSRAYYSMFHVAQALLERDGLSFSKHKSVISEFGRLYARTGVVPVEFHRFLIDAFEGRQQSDYAPREELTESMAAVHIAHARTVYEFIKQLLSGA